MGNEVEIKRGPTLVFKYALVFILLIVFGRASVSLYLNQWEKRRVQAEVSTKKEPSPAITVHVAGAVKKEGVYTIKNGSRVEDAIILAGGFEEYAHKDSMNLAAVLSDGDKVFVPPGRKVSKGRSKESLPEGFRVDLNSASELDLQMVPGIGPTLSGRIVNLRFTRGPYATIEEIKLVQGIGDSKFEQIKKYIYVEGK